MKIVTSQEMRELERRADGAGNSYAQMMERAGTLTAQAMMERWEMREKHVLVLVGPGNNGGDGLVAARVLHDAGGSVRLYVWKRAVDEDDTNWKLCAERGIPFTRAEDDPDFGLLREKLEHAEFIVDALLGTGVSRPIEGVLGEILETVRGSLRANSKSSLIEPSQVSKQLSKQSEPKVVAIDLPTGLNPDTGALDRAALPADVTVTFAFPKVGQYAFPGADAVGSLVVADIGIPVEWVQDIRLNVATADEMRTWMPKRSRNSNKGTFGKTMLVCGSLNFTGAPVLAAHAAGRAGTGLVTLAVPQTIQSTIGAKIDEATFLPLPDRVGDWRPRAANELLASLWDTPYDALVVGCGLGRAESTSVFLQRLLEHLPTLENPPGLVLDADALNLLAEIPEWWTHFEFSSPPILTPHPGEMARLRGIKTREVQANRIETARTAAQEWNAIVVLKGAFTLVAAPDGQVTLLPFANSALATAGTGDVLAGTIGGFLAQMLAAGKDDRVEPNPRRTTNDEASIVKRHAAEDEQETETGKRETASVKREALSGVRESGVEDSYRAAVVGGFVHALAGEIAAQEIGDAGVVAGDLVGRLPKARGMIVSGVK